MYMVNKAHFGRTQSMHLLDRNSRTGTATFRVVDILLISNKMSDKWRSISSNISISIMVNAWMHTRGVCSNAISPGRRHAIIRL